MSRHLNFAPNLNNLSRRINQKGAALNPKEGLAIHALFFPNSIVLACRAMFIRQEDHLQIMLGAKLGVALKAIFGHTND